MPVDQTVCSTVTQLQVEVRLSKMVLKVSFHVYALESTMRCWRSFHDERTKVRVVPIRHSVETQSSEMTPQESRSLTECPEMKSSMSNPKRERCYSIEVDVHSRSWHDDTSSEEEDSVDLQRLRTFEGREKKNSVVHPSSTSSLSEPDGGQLCSGIALFLSHLLRQDPVEGTRANELSSLMAIHGHISPESIYNDLMRLHDRGKWTDECLMIALVILNRFLSGPEEPKMDALNWKRWYVCALMIAHKSWDDLALKSIDFIILWTLVYEDDHDPPTLTELNAMERHMLWSIDYATYVRPSLYAKYYFSLRSLLAVELDSGLGSAQPRSQSYYDVERRKPRDSRKSTSDIVDGPYCQ